MAGNALKWIGRRLAGYINGPICNYEPYAVTPHGILEATLQPGDVLLVEGNRRVSVAIKYLTQSTWSHAALYVGDALEPVPAVCVTAGEGLSLRPNRHTLTNCFKI